MKESSALIPHNAGDELLDLVDAEDRVIGREYRSYIYQAGYSNLRVVNAFLRNSSGQLWIPRRKVAKHLFPLGLDVSMGGHVASGEDYQAAFVRELQEELNLDASLLAYRVLGRLTPKSHGVSAFMTEYEIRSDEQPAYNRADFCEAFWFTPRELFAVLANGDNSKDDLPRLVRLFYP